MSAGLAASTVTPGSTAPLSSLTTPAMELCANEIAGNSTSAATTAAPMSALRIERMMRTSRREPTPQTVTPERENARGGNARRVWLLQRRPVDAAGSRIRTHRETVLDLERFQIDDHHAVVVAQSEVRARAV